jgi:zinc protease
MGYLTGAFTQEVLDEQKSVVQNEKRQAETRPYAQMSDRIRAGLYPVGHPYRHSVIGSMEDLEAATIDDAREWFRTWYGATNAVLVLAGDVELETARDKVTRYFASAPAGEAVAQFRQWVPDQRGDRIEVMHDDVGQIRIARVWATPGLNHRDSALMYLVNQTLLGNRNAPLYKLLVDELELATSVYGAPVAKELNGEYRLYIDLKPGVEPEQVLPLVDEVINTFIAEGPDRQQVANAKLAVNMAIMGGLERSSAIGTVLAEGYLYSGNPLHINTELAWLNAATPADVQATSAKWLTRGYYQLTVLPFPEHSPVDDPVDRSTIPEATLATSDIEFPPIAARSLENGIRLVVAERGSIPLVDVSIRIGSGETAAPPDAHAVADFVFMLADKGTKKFDAGELAAARDRIAMAGDLAAGLEDSSYSYRILKQNLRESLAIAAEVLRHPTFPDEELLKLEAQIGGYLATLARAPASAAGSLFERAIFGAGSPMDSVWGPGSLTQVDRDRLRAFHSDEVAPDNISIYMIGPVDPEAAEGMVADTFGSWRAEAETDKRPIGSAPPGEPKVILVDQPNAVSSTIIAGHALPPWNADDAATLAVMNRIFGGSFESRLNMNLREDKAWSYGYNSSIASTQTGDQLLAMQGQVQADRTADAMAEIRKEFSAFATTAPATDEEVSRAVANRIRSLPGQFETNRGFLESIIAADSYGLPLDYASGRADRYAAVTRDAVVAQAESLFRPDELVWVIVGDLDRIEAAVRDLGYGEVEIWDAFGRQVR